MEQTPKHILITGATGFIGSALTPYLLARGHRITALVRNTSKAEAILGDKVNIVAKLSDINSADKVDAIINLAGEPIAGWLWTKAYRRKLKRSRINTTVDLVSFIRSREDKPEVMISASAVGYYGRRGSEIITEENQHQDIFVSRLCADWESVAHKVEDLGVRLVIPRISVVFGKHGSAFPKLVRPHRFGMGTTFGSGENYFPWIHIDDLIGIFDHALNRPTLSGAINAAAPDRVTQLTLNRAIATKLGKPCFIKAPAGIVRLALGEMSDLFLEGQNVCAQKIKDAGYEFKYPTLDGALDNLLDA